MSTIIEVSREFTNGFIFNSENRTINDKHVLCLQEQMKTSFEMFPAITVNQITRHVIDGQHRLTAYQNLVDSGEIPPNTTLKVMLVEMPLEKEKDAIRNANTNSKNWILEDYIISEAKKNINYEKLINWCSNHVLCVDGTKKKYRYGAAILKGMGCRHLLLSGTFTLSDEELLKGEIIHNELLEIVRLLEKPLKGCFYESLASSWYQMRHLHELKVWLKEMKRKKNILQKKPFASKADWDTIFSVIHREIDVKNN